MSDDEIETKYEQMCAKTADFIKGEMEATLNRADNADYPAELIMYVTACISLSAFMQMKRDEGGVEHALTAMTRVLNKAMTALDMGEANCRVAKNPEEMAAIAKELGKAMGEDSEIEYETGTIPDAVH